MAHPYGLPATENNGRPHTRHSATIYSLDSLNASQSDTVGRIERSDSSRSSDLERNDHFDAPGSESSIGSNAPRVHLETEADELWAILKAETGYSSYTDYVKAYKAGRPYPGKETDQLTFRISFPSLRSCGEIFSRFTILDLSDDEDRRGKITQRCDSASAATILRSVRRPPANVAVQIILWNLNARTQYDELNALGLGLRLNPRFFGDLYHGRRPKLDPSHVRIGGFVATVVRHYIDRPDAVPIVLIARLKSNSPLAHAVGTEFGDMCPFQSPAVQVDPFFAPRSSPRYKESKDIGIKEDLNYSYILNWCLGKEDKPALETSSMVTKQLIPLLYLSIIAMSDLCENIRVDYSELLKLVKCGPLDKEEKITSNLGKKRLRLRALVEEAEDDLSCLLKYIRSQTSAAWLLSDSWRKVEEDFKRIQDEASRLEVQIRDYLQLRVGEWALQESKKSIELSNRQIEEGKRGQ